MDSAKDSKTKDKNDRATVEQVLDPRTLIILHKLLKIDKLDRIEGCVSTGKEANVYYAHGGKDLLSHEEDAPKVD